MLSPEHHTDRHSAESSAPEAFLLSSDVVIVVWDVRHKIVSSPALALADGGRVAPMASLRLPLGRGGTRLIWAFRPQGMDSLDLSLSAGALGPIADLKTPPRDALIHAPGDVLLDDLPDGGRATLLNALLNTWVAMFKLGRSRSFTRFLNDLVGLMAADPLPVRIIARATAGQLILQTSAPRSVATIKTIHLVSADGLRRLPTEWKAITSQSGRKIMSALADMASAPASKTTMLITGAEGVSIRRLAASQQIQTLPQWWRARKNADPAMREHLIALLGGGSAAARAAAMEFQIACPLPARSVAGRGGLPSCEVNLALVTPSGALVGGWYRDDADAVEGVDILDCEGAPHPIDVSWHRFPGEVPGENGEEPSRAKGFVSFVPVGRGQVPLLQPRFQLRLKSGLTRPLVPPPQAGDVAEARARALSIIPPQHVSAEAIENCLAQPLADLQQAVVARLGTPRVIEMGERPERPLASLVIPLYRTLDFLRFQIAAFASDPWLMSNAEFIYVLDSPEQAEEVEHLLRGLHILYGLPTVLAVMTHNGGYAPASNAGAALARGALLAMVNSDVIPIKSGWLAMLASRIGGGQRIGAVGPKLLFEDGAIQHAGMYFARDTRGNWLNHHFHKGMPRSYAPAQKRGVVPAVTGACLITPRELFEQVGGFTQDYVIGDYEDSDLCLKIRALGNAIAYVPEAELYHLERRSIRQSADYMRGAASRYNSWLHARRWGDAMAELMSPETPAESEGRVAA